MDRVSKPDSGDVIWVIIPHLNYFKAVEFEIKKIERFTRRGGRNDGVHDGLRATGKLAGEPCDGFVSEPHDRWFYNEQHAIAVAAMLSKIARAVSDDDSAKLCMDHIVAARERRGLPS